MSRWFRMYDDAMNDPKVQRLPPHLFKAWFNVLCLANKAGNGVLPAVADIAFALRMSDTDAQSVLDELILSGLIDIAPDKSLSPHNWKSRQAPSDKSKERTRRWREGLKEKSGDASQNVTVTASDDDGDCLDSDSAPEKENIITTTEQEAAREKEDFKICSVGSSWVEGKISPEVKLRVCSLLGITDADDIEARFWAWQRKLPPSRRARDPEAVFVKGAETLLSRLTPEQIARLKVPQALPEPVKPPAKASPSLVAALRKVS